MLDYIVEYIGDSLSLDPMLKRMESAPALALDIETINWWDRQKERVSLLQLAFREDDRAMVVIIDALGDFDPELLRQPLELSSKIKAIHNAGYDAVRIARHYSIATSPIHDTMLAARRSGEKRCSLQAQTETHFGFRLDKSEQRGDWSRRPLNREQLNYAALDAACTLLLYERQVERGLRGDYQLRDSVERRQASLPLTYIETRIAAPLEEAVRIEPESSIPVTTDTDLSSSALALLGIVTELSGRYSPEQLAASVGSGRVGLAGWIIDLILGLDADIDEDCAKQEIATLCERGTIQIGLSRRLEATVPGTQLWQRIKPL